MSTTPAALRRTLSVDDICGSDPCDATAMLGSFWPGSRSSFESHIVKAFKECSPASEFEPHISLLCEFYSKLVLDATGEGKLDWIARVLSSSEREPEPSRPQSLLVNRLCALTGARDITHVFFKSESRPSMRTVARLSGPDALRSRVQYVLQDLFVKPFEAGGRVLLIDDIYNTGASMRVYAAGLKQHTGAQWVTGINLAATRFSRGKDGHGHLSLDTSGLGATQGLDCLWLDSADIYHDRRDCPSAQQHATAMMRFVAERRGTPCSTCFPAPAVRPRRWWQIF